MQNNPGIRLNANDELVFNEVNSLEHYNKLSQEERAKVLNKIAVRSAAVSSEKSERAKEGLPKE